jgi:2-polyprenyl-6-methoxyphenol hydroxylase-like FAD-dependent oxidoreductase
MQRSGHRVRVFERVPELLPVGAGFMLQPTGLDVLHTLGLLPDVLKHGAVVSQLDCRTHSGRTLLKLDYREVDARAYGIGMHRATLLDILMAALHDAGIEAELGCTVDAIEVDSAAKATLVLGERREGPFDLVICCDGARSQLRAAHGPPYRADVYPWGAYWYICADKTGIFDGRLSQVVRGARQMLGVLPTGRTLDDKTPLVSVFWSVALNKADQLRELGLQHFKDTLVGLYDEAEPLLAQLESLDQLTLARYMDVRMKPWHRGPVVFIGDSAHATSPQLGQGVNLALVDAMALSESVGETKDVESALQAYRAARRKHLAYYQFTTRLLTPFFQSNSKVLGWTRDLVFPVVGLFGPLRRQMVRTMCGVKRGFFSKSMPLPALELAPPKDEALSGQGNEALAETSPLPVEVRKTLAETET